MEDTTTASDNPARLTMGAIIASAVVAALVAFFLRRAMRDQEEEQVEAEITEAAFRERAATATGEFFKSHVAPEVKPMLLNVLRDVRDYVDRGFQRAEQSIKEF